MRLSGKPQASRLKTLVLLAWLTCLVWLTGRPVHARAEVVRLSELEKKAMQGGAALQGDVARARGANAEVDRAVAARKPRFALKADSTLGPGRPLIRVYDKDDFDPRTGQLESDADSNLVQGTPSTSQGASAFAPQLRNGLELNGQATLYDFGRTKAEIRAGRAGYAASLAQGEATRSAIVLSVRARYLAWLSAHQLAQFAGQAATEAAQRRERVAALIAANARPAGDLMPARADELLTKLELERAQGDLASAQLSLEQAAGVSLGTEAEPELDLLNVEAPASASAQDAASRVLTKQHTAAMALVRMHQKGSSPELATGVSAGMRNQGANFFPLYGAALTLTVPLWDGGLASANAEAARAKAAEIDAQRRAHETDRQNRHEHAALDAANARARLTTIDELLEVCQQRLDDAKAAFELGVTGIDGIAQARSLLRRAQTERLLAQVAQTEAHLRVAPIVSSGPAQ